ncbi:MAG: hypothetical protein ACRC0G_02515 [Fusobacteriaceae bacterium]
MIIDSLTSTSVYVEKKSLLKIVGNSTTNNVGLLEVDSNGNKLISTIDSGDTSLYRLSKYNGGDGLMVYNPTTKNIQIATDGDFLDVGIDFERGTKYYVGARLIKSSTHTSNVFDVPLNGLNVFKIFMDGRELKSYSITNNNIIISGNERLMIDEFSELVIYAYNTTNILSEDNLFEMEYYQYDKVWDLDLFGEEEYFEEFRGISVDLFESMSINQNVTKTTYRGGFKYSDDSRLNSIDNTADLNLFSGTGAIDLVQYVGNDDFRMVFVNLEYGRFVLLNNCKADNGVSLILEKAKNMKKLSLSCGNYIDINIATPSAYGRDEYGRRLYGNGAILVYNSHRKGEY